MSRSTRRTLLHGALLLIALALFAVAPAGLMKLGAALAGGAVALAFVLTSDEVERALAGRASAFAFSTALAASIALTVPELREAAVTHAEFAWAALVAAWLVGWTIFRVRLA